MKSNKLKIMSKLVLIIFLISTIFNVNIKGVQGSELHFQKMKDILSDKLYNQSNLTNQLEKLTKDRMNKLDKLENYNGQLSNLNKDENIRLIIQLEGDPVVKSSTNGNSALTISKSIKEAKNSQNNIIKKVEKLTGSKVRESYGYLVNGFSINAKRNQIDKIKEISGVKSVNIATSYHVDMNFAKQLTQTYSTWNDLGYKGEGMVISIIDTGIDYNHKDLVLSDSSKAKLTSKNPQGPGKYFSDKVPYGYNFADGNTDVIDKNSKTEMHGMHVAGIAAANGNSEDASTFKSVQGVAPEAQLLDMKVFSNDPNNQSAYSDDIIAAIEDSVLHGADVINISLGSDSGFTDTEDPEQIAVKNAVDQGVVVVTAAGNSSVSTGDPLDYLSQKNLLGNVDTGTLEEPATAKDAISVASFENTYITDTKKGGVSNPNANDMSYFSSWGPTPSLDFKPELTAPGGNIYSLANDNSYQTMSGTSMAAPNVSGGEALILQGIKDKKTGLYGRDLVEFAKNTAINTAEIEMEKENNSVPYSPRRQGSGLLEIKNAIKNNVIVTDSTGNAAISMKEIGKTTTFDLTLRNYGNTDVTYTLPTGYVLSESIDKDTSLIKEYSIPGANMSFDKNTIIVHSKSDANVKVTITLPDDFNKQQYVEGFIKLVSNDKSIPSLNVPYIGFYGNWSELTNIDKPCWEEDSLTTKALSNFMSNVISEEYGASIKIKAEAGTELFTISNNNIIPCGLVSNNNINYDSIEEANVSLGIINQNKIAFSPNGDECNDLLIPNLYHLRNIKNIKVDILDKNKKVIRTLNEGIDISKDFLQKNLISGYFQNTMGTFDSNYAWDGTLYDASTGKYAVASEGQYYIRIASKADIPNAKEQVIDMPVKLDISAPQVKITSESVGTDSKCSLKWTETDNGSGINPLINGILINGQPVDNNAYPITYDEKTETYSCDVDLEQDTNNLIEIGAQDYAGNVGMDNIYVKNGSPATVSFNNLQDNMKLNNKNFIVKGQVRDDVNSLSINGANVTIGNNLTFEQTIALQEGTNSITVKALDNNNNELFNNTYNVDCDDVAPEISLTKPSEDSNGIVYTDNNTLTVSGKVTDDHFSGLKINNMDTTVDTNGNFTANVNIQDNTYIPIEATDDYGNITNTGISVIYTANTMPFQVNFDNLSSYMLLPKVAANNDVYLITGHVNHPTKVFNINDTSVEVNKDLSFSFPVKLSQGKNAIKLYAEDDNQTVLLDQQFKVFYAKEVPKLTMSNPSVNEDGNIYTNQDSINVNGQTVSEGFNYSLYIDGSSVMKVVNAPINSSKDFSYNVPVKNGDKLDIVLNDDAGNNYEDVINVVVDKTAPTTPTITLDNTKPTNKSVLVTVNADKSDKDIAKIEYSFDHNTWLQYNESFSVPFNTRIYAKITDFAGNTNEKYLDITNIDKTPPRTPRINLDSIQPTNKDVIVTINTDQSDKDIANVQYSFDNNRWTEYTKSFSVSANTKVYAKAIDSVGNYSDISTLEIKNIDKTPPVISISGIEDGGIYNYNVKPCITSNDGTLALLLDNNVYNQEAITTEGNHIIKVRAVDEAGNISYKQVSFTIDKIAPVISVTGIENGGTYYNRASANISVNEGSYRATLDDKVYTGADITALGSHKLIIISKDTANNISAKTINFVIAPALSNDPASSDLIGKTIVALPDKAVNVNFNNTTIVNETFFRDIVGIDKNISFTVNSNNTPITWTFNGKDIDKSNLKNIDLSLNNEAPNKDVISKIDGNSQILSFKDNGVLPAPATLKIKIDSAKVNINKGIYFYYYNPTTKNTELIAGPLTPDADGFVIVTIKHCSDYFFSNNDNTKIQSSVESLPKTGILIDTKLLMVIGIGFVVLGVILGFYRRFRQYN